MNRATIDQKHQLIAKLATGTNHKCWDRDKLQVLLGLPTEGFNLAIARLLNEWQSPAVKQETATVSEPELPEILETFTRRVKVNRRQNKQEALDANGRNQYITKSVVDEMPVEGEEEVEVTFFRVGVWVSADLQDKLCQKQGLDPDPLAVNQANIDEPALADTRPNTCQWKDAKGNWCYATFDRWRGERGVNVDRSGGGWNGSWWFAGVRK